MFSVSRKICRIGFIHNGLRYMVRFHRVRCPALTLDPVMRRRYHTRNRFLSDDHYDQLRGGCARAIRKTFLEFFRPRVQCDARIVSDRFIESILNDTSCQSSWNLTFRSGFAWNFAVLPYGDAWRAHRRMFHQYFREKAVEKYKPLQMAQCEKYLRRLYTHPEDFFRLTLESV